MDEALRRIVLEATAQAIEQLAPKIAAEVVAQMHPALANTDYLDTNRAAKIAGVAPDTIREWVKQGRLPRCGRGRVRIKECDLRALMENRTPADSVTDEDIEERASATARRLLGR